MFILCVVYLSWAYIVAFLAIVSEIKCQFEDEFGFNEGEAAVGFRRRLMIAIILEAGQWSRAADINRK